MYIYIHIYTYIYIYIYIVCIGISTPSLKNTIPSFLPSLPLNLQAFQAPLYRQFPPLYQFFVNCPLKVGFFSELPKYRSFSSLAPSYLLEGTKFLVKNSQFEFMVMTEKNIFVYKFLLSLVLY